LGTSGADTDKTTLPDQLWQVKAASPAAAGVGFPLWPARRTSRLCAGTPGPGPAGVGGAMIPGVESGQYVADTRCVSRDQRLRLVAPNSHQPHRPVLPGRAAAADIL